MIEQIRIQEHSSYRKGEFNFSLVWPIEIKPRPIENRKHDFFAEFYFSPNITKMFRVSSETLLDIREKT